MTRYFSGILLLLLAVTGCKKSSDYSLENPYGSKLEVTSDYKKSSFTLPLKSSSSEVVIDKIKVELISLSSGKVINVEASVQFKLGALVCTLRLQRDSTIPDSDYHLRLIHEHPDIPKHNFVVSFRDEMMCGLLSDPDKNYYAGIPGKGTAENPYLLTSENFKTFMYGLFNDVSRGRGLHFKQIVDIKAPETSNSSDGSGYRGEDFAGNYDGGGFTFSFKYTGDRNNSKYTNSGMFATLNSGAKISNLKIVYEINGVNSYAGALAGRSEGSLEIHNVQTEGNIIDANRYAGGLIGAVVGSQGDVLRIENVEFDGSINGTSYLGGLIGAVDGVAVDIKNANSKPYKPVKGNDYVGGLIGSFIGETITISQCALEHSVSQEDEGIVILNASGSKCGGVIGYAKVSQSLNMESVIVDMSVGNFNSPAGVHIGGLLGAMDVRGGKYVNFKNCMVNGFVTGSSYVGGFVGHTYSSGANINFIGRANYMSSNVKGSGNYVGGMFGYAENIIVEPVSEINISTLVKGGERCGGFAGCLLGSKITMNDKFKISSLTNVVGDNSVGGFVGYAGSSDFIGTTVVRFYNDSKIIPSKSSFNKVVYSGKVNSTENNISSSDNAGGFIGYGDKVIINGIVVSASVYGRSCIGGIAGRLSDSKFSDCVSSGEHVQAAGSEAGGVVGYLNSGGMSSVANYTKVKSSGGSVGGVVGAVSSSATTISTVVNMGLVDGAGSAGGVVGSKVKNDQSLKIDGCANYGAIKGNNLENGSMGIGGIIGWVGDRITIEDCANHGPVSSSGNHYKGIGGIAGVLGTDFDPMHPSDSYNNASVLNCINTGTLTGITGASEYIGGIVGFLEEGGGLFDVSLRVDNCLNTANVESDSKANNGGIVGCTSDYNHVYRCLNTGIVRYGNGVVGTHIGTGAADNHDYLYSVKGGNSNENKDYRLTAYITDSNKSNTSTYKGFDFKETWQIGSLNNGYPYLSNCYFQFYVKGE